jgi:hypothetical protein
VSLSKPPSNRNGSPSCALEHLLKFIQIYGFLTLNPGIPEYWDLTFVYKYSISEKKEEMKVFPTEGDLFTASPI